MLCCAANERNSALNLSLAFMYSTSRYVYVSAPYDVQKRRRRPRIARATVPFDELDGGVGREVIERGVGVVGDGCGVCEMREVSSPRNGATDGGPVGAELGRRVADVALDKSGLEGDALEITGRGETVMVLVLKEVLSLVVVGSDLLLSWSPVTVM